jgi:hypothetical protein
LNCGKWFQKDKNGKTKSSSKGVDKKSILVDHLDGISYRNLEKRNGIGRTKLCEITNEQLSNFEEVIEITKRFSDQLKYSGNLVVDGKCIQVKEAILGLRPFGKIPKSKKHFGSRGNRVITWGIDYWKHDIPHFEFGESENGFVFNDYFLKLKEIKYPLKSLTTDDRSELARAAKRHYPDCVIQLCIKHYFEKINKILTIGLIKTRIEAKIKKLDNLFQGNSEYIPTTRKQHIILAAQLSNEIAEMEFRYELLIDFQDIIQDILWAPDYEIANRRIESLNKYFWPKRFRMRDQYNNEHIKTIKKLISDFREHEEYLLNYLEYPRLNIPHTTNMVEGLNSQLETRVNSLKGFELDKTAKNYINAWILKRRFSKYTDCKREFKKLNGKTPLECAGADISDIRDWVDFCQKQNSPLK